MDYLSHAMSGVVTPFHREQLTFKAGQIDQDPQYIGIEPFIQTLSAMKLPLRILPALLLALAAGCSTLMPPPINAGDTEASLIAKRGQPAHRYQDGQYQLLEYPTGYWGQRTYMARIGPDGKVVSFEQVLTSQNFATIKAGESTKADVLRTVGAPIETSYLPLSDLEVWTYGYREANAWDSMMHIHFDRAGIVRKMVNGPDPRFNPDLNVPFGPLLRR
jgi:hypothetical protein